MASKQIPGPLKNAERAKATESTFGKSGDPWREGPAMAGMRQAFSPHKDVRGGGTSATGDIAWVNEWKTAAYKDRYGTSGGVNESNQAFPEKVEATQRDDAKMKGSAAEGYRVEITQISQ